MLSSTWGLQDIGQEEFLLWSYPSITCPLKMNPTKKEMIAYESRHLLCFFKIELRLPTSCFYLTIFGCIELLIIKTIARTWCCFDFYIKKLRTNSMFGHKTRFGGTNISNGWPNHLLSGFGLIKAILIWSDYESSLTPASRFLSFEVMGCTLSGFALSQNKGSGVRTELIPAKTKNLVSTIISAQTGTYSLDSKS